MTDSELWERQDGEGARPYEAFCVYRDMGVQRSIRAVCQNIAKTRHTVSAWASQYHWAARSDAYDMHLERERRAAHEAAIRRMADEHAKIARAAMIKCAQRLQTLDPDKIGIMGLARLMEVAARLEREALGIPDRIEVNGTMKHTVITVDAIEARIRELEAELAQ